MSESKKIQLTGLWSKQVNGKTLLTGYLGNAQVEIWQNSYKTKENQPDFIMYLAPKFKAEKKEEHSFDQGGQFGPDEIPF